METGGLEIFFKKGGAKWILEQIFFKKMCPLFLVISQAHLEKSTQLLLQVFSSEGWVAQCIVGKSFRRTKS